MVPVLAAGIFVARMLNWPIPGGTSLRFVGGALAGVLLCPYLVISIVLLMQYLIFNDGSITALGANVLNMGIVDVLVGYATYVLALELLGPKRKARLIGAFVEGWLGITLAGWCVG